MYVEVVVTPDNEKMEVVLTPKSYSVLLLIMAGCGSTPKIENVPVTLADGERKFWLDRRGVLHGAEGLSSSQSQTIAGLLGGSPFPAPSYLKDILKDQFDAGDGEEIEPIEPVLVVETVNPPRFRWKPVQAVATYEVVIRDHRNYVVRKSGTVEETEWTPTKPLIEGEVFSWRVVAGKRVSHWAKFAIPGSAAMAEIEAVRELQPPSHLLLAIAFARCGALAGAETELSKLDGELVARWRAQLK